MHACGMLGYLSIQNEVSDLFSYICFPLISDRVYFPNLKQSNKMLHVINVIRHRVQMELNAMMAYVLVSLACTVIHTRNADLSVF